MGKYSLIFGYDLNRRSRLEIYIDILEAVADGNSKPSHIMYKSNLSWKKLKGYLNFLVDQGLLIRREHRRRERYEISERGLKILLYFRKIKEIFQLDSELGDSTGQSSSFHEELLQQRRPTL